MAVLQGTYELPVVSWSLYQYDHRNMIKDFRLVLHHLTGQVICTVPGKVTGNVVVVTFKPKLYNAITVTLRGDADAHIPVGRAQFQSHKEIVCKTIELWISEHVSNRVLNPGEYVFPFKFTLQPLFERFPSSFSGSHRHKHSLCKDRRLKCPSFPLSRQNSFCDNSCRSSIEFQLTYQI